MVDSRITLETRTCVLTETSATCLVSHEFLSPPLDNVFIDNNDEVLTRQKAGGEMADETRIVDDIRRDIGDSDDQSVCETGRKFDRDFSGCAKSNETVLRNAESEVNDSEADKVEY